MTAPQTRTPLTLQPSRHGAPAPHAYPIDPEAPDHRAITPWDLPSSAGFIAVLTAFRHTGGTARGDDLAGLLHDQRRGDVASLAKLIAARRVFGFSWRNTFWVPMFQFDTHDLSLRPEPQKVLALLATTYDGWALATWFAQPHPQLADQRPVDVLATDLPAVLAAAYADRAAAAG